MEVVISLRRVLTTYFRWCVVFCCVCSIYATLILYIDLVLWPNCWTDDDLANLNRVYLGAGCVALTVVQDLRL